VVKKSILVFATVALAVASAANSYSVTFFQPVVVSGQTLKAGDYKVEFTDNKATIRQGKAVTEASIKVESNADKYSTTSVRLNGTQVEEIRLGGTHTRLVFEKTGAGTN
jgi:hypothetical protein